MNAQEPSSPSRVGAAKWKSTWTVVKPLLSALATVAVTALVTLLLLEIGLRIASPGVGFTLQNYATEPVAMVRINHWVKYDSELGFVHVGNRMDFGLGPIGNRISHKTKAGDPVPPLPSNAILAAGASFTFGSEVGPTESWPAQLEQITKIPVINGGVGNYGLDQIVLRAERLVPQLKPRLVIVDIVSTSVDYHDLSIASGAPKPYFDVVNGQLVLRNVPVPHYHAGVGHAGVLRSILGYSYLADWTLDRLGLRNWWQLSKYETKYVHPGMATEIGCLLMSRLKALSEREKVPILVLAEYNRAQVREQQAVVIQMMNRVFDCAKANNLMTLNLFPALLAVHKKDADEFTSFYVKGIGHMSPKGNRFVAEQIAEFLRTSSLSNLLQPPFGQ